jgi:Domain of unknown function (DUF4249)
MKKILLPFATMASLLVACTKDVTVDLPTTDPKLVVEGTMEVGQPPLVILTRTQNYFDPTDINSIASIFVKNAAITVSDGTNTVTLQETAFTGLTPEQLEQVALLTGIDPALLQSISVYSLLDGSMIGVSGRTYTLNVQADGKSCSAVTQIPQPVALDSLWWRLAEQNPDDDSSGFAWARLTDPDTLGNGYRWMARRFYSQDTSAVPDSRFIAPLGSSFVDKYINGLSFDFFAVRGRSPFTDNSDDETAGYFLRGDSVAVKFVSMGLKEADFYVTYDNNVASQGDLFSTPSNARTNINGGLGIWAGWATYMDTLVCQ